MNLTFHGKGVGVPAWMTSSTDISLSRLGGGVGGQRGFQGKKDPVWCLSHE